MSPKLLGRSWALLILAVWIAGNCLPSVDICEGARRATVSGWYVMLTGWASDAVSLFVVLTRLHVHFTLIAIFESLNLSWFANIFLVLIGVRLWMGRPPFLWSGLGCLILLATGNGGVWVPGEAVACGLRYGAYIWAASCLLGVIASLTPRALWRSGASAPRAPQTV